MKAYGVRFAFFFFFNADAGRQIEEMNSSRPLSIKN